MHLNTPRKKGKDKDVMTDTEVNEWIRREDEIDR